MTFRKSDVLILGGGAIGLATALQLLKSGASVRVVEQGKVGNGASHANCGTLTPSHAIPLLVPGMLRKSLGQIFRRDAPLYISPRPDLNRLLWLLKLAHRTSWARVERAAEARMQLLQRSMQLTAQWVREEPLDCEYAADGSLYVYRDAQSFREAEWHAEMLERLGLEVQRLNGAAVQAMEPALLPGMSGGYFHPGDAHLRPDRFVDELARRVRELGGIIEESARIEKFHTEGKRVDAVRTHRGVYSGERLVMALGAWSPQLAHMIGLRLPMQPGKGYSLTWTRPPRAPLRPLMLREDSVCVTSWDSGFRLGSTLEFSGYDSQLRDVRLNAIRRAAARYLREPAGPMMREMWWGWRPMSVDQLPIIGIGKRWSNLVYATAHGMLGMSMAAATAQIVAECCGAGGGASDILIDAFSPRRFGL
jgi:D-amino-acid dehydrogenase